MGNRCMDEVSSKVSVSVFVVRNRCLGAYVWVLGGWGLSQLGLGSGEGSVVGCCGWWLTVSEYGTHSECDKTESRQEDDCCEVDVRGYIQCSTHSEGCETEEAVEYEGENYCDNGLIHIYCERFRT